MITIWEYLEWKQPTVAAELRTWILRAKIFGLSTWQWKQIMEERPLPGRAGILPGEEEAVL